MLTFLVLLIVGANSIEYSVADIYSITGQVPPDESTYPPVITITSPINDTAYNASRLPLTFNVSAPYSSTASASIVKWVRYETDWQNKPIDVLIGSEKQPSFNLQLSKIPEGHHTIVIRAEGSGLYANVNEAELTYKEFSIGSTATICFTIDRTAPDVSILPIENVSSNFPTPLSFTANETCSKVTYSLNGQQNVTVSGNSTLPHLPAGQYNVTIYVWDAAGNVGTSETTDFIVDELPQTAEFTQGSLILLVTVALSTIVIIVVLLLVKRNYR